MSVRRSCGPVGVLALTLNSRVGGTEKFLLDLYQRLDKTFFHPLLVTLVGDGLLTRMAQDRGIEALHLGMRGPLDARVVLRIWELLRTRDISIVHTYLYHTSIVGRFLGWAAGVPVLLCSQRSTDDWRSWFHVALDRFTQSLVDGYVANCQAVADRLKNIEKITSEKIRVVRTGIEPLAVPSAQARQALRKEWNVPAEAMVIGTVANLRPAKGHEALIEAAGKVLEEFPGTVFVWVGDGPLRRELESKIFRAGLEKNFRLLGFLENPVPAYGAFDLFALPSLWEGFPRALLEAMSVGLPIVATRVGGIQEILTDGSDARLVAPNDSDAFAAAMLSLLRFPEIRQSLGLKAQARFARENSLDRCVRETETLYRACLEKTRG